MKHGDLADEIKAGKAEIDNLRDAFDMIDETLGEEDALKLFLGEALVSVDEDTARSYLEKLVDEKEEELNNKQDAMDKIEGEMKDLKSFLYAKFGNSINLDEDK